MRREQLLLHVVELGLIADLILQQPRLILRITAQLTANPQERNAGLDEHAADLIDGAVGVGHQQQVGLLC